MGAGRDTNKYEERRIGTALHHAALCWRCLTRFARQGINARDENLTVVGMEKYIGPIRAKVADIRNSLRRSHAAPTRRAAPASDGELIRSAVSHYEGEVSYGVRLGLELLIAENAGSSGRLAPTADVMSDERVRSSLSAKGGSWGLAFWTTSLASSVGSPDVVSAALDSVKGLGLDALEAASVMSNISTIASAVSFRAQLRPTGVDAAGCVMAVIGTLSKHGKGEQGTVIAPKVAELMADNARRMSGPEILDMAERLAQQVNSPTLRLWLEARE